jgi:electron transport complex protein RnfA
MNQIPLIVLMIFSAFTMNLVLQCALGIKGASESVNPGRIVNLIRLGIIFISIVLLWVLFSRLIPLVISGIFVYVILFPVSFMVYDALEYLFFQYVLKQDTQDECYICFPGGITAAAVFICMNIAGSFLQTLVLAFGFVLGTYIVLIIIGEIRRRAVLEAVPEFLRGKPLVLISMGMLSLVFSSASLLLFNIIGAK